MSDQRDNGIAWTDETWNPIRGCSRVSEGCRNCYAEKVAARFSGPGLAYEGLVTIGEKGPRWNGTVRLVPEHLGDPLRWKRPRRVFVNSMSDLFHESLPFETIAAVFGVMAAAPQHTFQVLTKRPKRAKDFFAWLGAKAGRERNEVLLDAALNLLGTQHVNALGTLRAPWTRADPLPNVWLGVSVEDQATADERIPLLLECPGAVRWVSYEPALGPVNFGKVPGLNKAGSAGQELLRNFWIVVGGESGTGARPFDLAWARSIVAQCKTAGVPVFVKQLGALPFDSHGHAPADELDRLSLHDRKGGDMAEWPADLRVRQWPGAA